MYRRQSPITPLVELDEVKWEELFHTRVASHFGDPEAEEKASEDLGLCDLSFLPKLGLKGPGAEDWLKDEGIPTPAQVYGVERFDQNAFIIRVDTREFFLEDSLNSNRVRNLSRILGRGQPGAYRVERQDASFFVSGRRAPQVLAQTCGYNFQGREEMLVMTRVAVVSCSVLPTRIGLLIGFRIWTGPSQGLYLWESLLDIVRDLGGSQVGVGCLRLPSTG